jgi:hypothetical protein
VNPWNRYTGNGCVPSELIRARGMGTRAEGRHRQSRDLRGIGHAAPAEINYLPRHDLGQGVVPINQIQDAQRAFVRVV